MFNALIVENTQEEQRKITETGVYVLFFPHPECLTSQLLHISFHFIVSPCEASVKLTNVHRPTSSTVRLGRCSIPSSSFSFTGGDRLEKQSRILSMTDTVRREAMLGGVHSSSVEPSLL